MHPTRELPELLATLKLNPEGQEPTTWYDCKFCPYTPPTSPPVFAVTGSSNTVICRCLSSKDEPIQILRWFQDEDYDPAERNSPGSYSLSWSRAENGDPLICVAGTDPRIKVLNVKTGEIVTTLAGHGGTIHDLVICPTDPYVLASASDDMGIRLWSLDPAHEKQRTAALIHGEGYKEPPLALGFHRKGRWLLSGGLDSRLNLWHVPEIQKGGTLSDTPKFIHYPHFSTGEIHTDYVDCVQFYGDVVVSKSVRGNEIIMWSIDGFNPSSNSPPPDPPVPLHLVSSSTTEIEYVPRDLTTNSQSAWGGRYQRLLCFRLPHSQDEYCVRFSIYHQLSQPPVLAAGNVGKSTIYFWDLERLEDAGIGDVTQLPESAVAKYHCNNSGDGNITVSTSKTKKSSSNSGRSTPATDTGDVRSFGRAASMSKERNETRCNNDEGDEGACLRKGIGDPFHPIPAHKSITVDKAALTVRQVAWSPCGNWCVAVGDKGLIAVFSR